MKKVIFTLFSFCAMYATSNAQYCGSFAQPQPPFGTPSGTNACTVTPLDKPGLQPVPDSLAPIVNGTQANTTIKFQNFDTTRAAGQLVTIQQLRIDSIGNLPLTTCWVTSKADNTFRNKEDGCIKVNGLVCAEPGQYRLKILVTPYIGSSFPGIAILGSNQDAGALAGLYYYVRVVNPGDTAEHPIDTTGQSAGTGAFKPYGGSANCTVGVKEISNNINELTVVPNPFSNKAVVSFYADKAGIATERLTNMIGSEVYRRTLDVKAGENSSMIDRNSLPAGIYFYSISDGKTLTTRRVVISE